VELPLVMFSSTVRATSSRLDIVPERRGLIAASVFVRFTLPNATALMPVAGWRMPAELEDR